MSRKHHERKLNADRTVLSFAILHLLFYKFVQKNFIRLIHASLKHSIRITALFLLFTIISSCLATKPLHPDKIASFEADDRKTFAICKRNIGRFFTVTRIKMTNVQGFRRIVAFAVKYEFDICIYGEKKRRKEQAW